MPDGYTSKTTGSAEKGFTITNTKKPGEPTNPGAPENPSNPDDTNDTDNTDGTEKPSTPNPDKSRLHVSDGGTVGRSQRTSS